MTDFNFNDVMMMARGDIDALLKTPGWTKTCESECWNGRFNQWENKNVTVKVSRTNFGYTPMVIATFSGVSGNTIISSFRDDGLRAIRLITKNNELYELRNEWIKRDLFEMPEMDNGWWATVKRMINPYPFEGQASVLRLLNNDSRYAEPWSCGVPIGDQVAQYIIDGVVVDGRYDVIASYPNPDTHTDIVMFSTEGRIFFLTLLWEDHTLCSNIYAWVDSEHIVEIFKVPGWNPNVSVTFTKRWYEYINAIVEKFATAETHRVCPSPVYYEYDINNL